MNTFTCFNRNDLIHCTRYHTENLNTITIKPSFKFLYIIMSYVGMYNFYELGIILSLRGLLESHVTAF